MRTQTDVLRSLKRVIFLALPGYEIRFDGEEGAGKRPMAIVKSTTPNTITGQRIATDNVQGFMVYVYPKPGENAQDSRVLAGAVANVLEEALGAGVINSELADGGVGRPSLIPLYDFEEKTWKQGIASYAESTLADDIDLPQATIELVKSDDFTASGLLYIGDEVLAYTGNDEGDDEVTGVTGGTGSYPAGTKVRQMGDRLRPDYAQVRDLTIDVKQSPDDENLYTVLAEVRLGWRRGRVLPSNADTVDAVHVSFE